VYTQNFDSLPNPGAASVNTANPVTINGVTYTLSNPFGFAAPVGTGGVTGGTGIAALQGWYGLADPDASVGTRFGATDGDQTTGGLISYGEPNSSNRGLGLQATSTTGYTAFGVKFINETGVNLNYINLSFTGEVWRQSDKSKTLAVYYWLDSTVTNTFTTNATQFLPALNVSFPTVPSATGGVAVDGTQPDNQQGLAVLNQPILSWRPGTALWLVWEMASAAATSQGLGIDNLSFSAVAQPPMLVSPSLTAQTTGPAGGGEVLLLWSTVANQLYQLQFSTNLAAPNWTAVGNPMPGTGQPLGFTNHPPTGVPAGYYRLLVMP
jgi:hypothetical protein